MHPHETQFRYDNALLASCASSQLAHIIKSQVDGELKSFHDSAPTYQKKHQNNIRGTAANNIGCKSLFQQHAIHYKRPILTNEEKQFWNLWEAGNNTQHVNIKMSTRIETFLNSVLFIHEHNTNTDKTHKVGLNRFSDMSSHELPLMPQSSSTTNSDNFDPLQSIDSFLPHNLHMDGLDSKHNPVFTPLDDDETILKFGRAINQLQEERFQQSSATDAPKENVFQRMRDSWWWLGGGHNNGNTQDDTTNTPLTRHSRMKIMKKSKDNSSLLDKENKMGGLSEGSDNNKWLHHLNWATDDNPDGVPIVHEAMDQGLCGSCWAISATGTLEASIARNMAYISYEDAYSFASSQHDDQDIDPQLVAVAAAQQIEQQSINTADLSVQELVDCDTRYDQGCAGGNPLLAFYFLHRFGVTSTKNYPYTGTMGTCKYHKVDQPIATVKTWGILTPDHEANIEKVVRYIGPVAVGLIGADPAFLSYESGVFMSTKGKEGKCETSQADHGKCILCF